MAYWYEVYDNQDVLLSTRQRVGRLTTIYSLATLTIAAVAPLLIVHVRGGVWVAGFCGVALLFGGLYVYHALRKLGAVAWCVKLSIHHLFADFGRRRTTIPWSSVTRLDVDDEGLIVVGLDENGAPQRLRIPNAFPRFSQLSHRMVEYAEAHNRPIFVEGRPWELLDPYELYPFLRDTVREA